MTERHSLLKRQIKQCFGNDSPPEPLLSFLEAVNQAYLAFDDDRRMLERSLELSSQELLQANTDMRVLFDAFPDLLFRLNFEGIILDYRAGKEIGAAMPEVSPIGKHIQDLFPAGRESFESALRSAREDLIIPSIEYSVSVKGQDQFYEARFVPLNGSQLVAIVRNVTQRKELEAKLLQSQKMDTLGKLAGSIAHDLNNQLTPVHGYLDMILHETDKKNPLYTLLSEANQATVLGIEIVQRLLNFSRPASATKQSIDVGALVDGITKMLPQFVPATVETRVLIEPDLWSVRGNATELQTVIVNLIVNARDAMADGGKLTVRVGKAMAGDAADPDKLPRPCVVISVNDSGCGMTPEVMKHLFEPFFSTKGRAKGTGLGLSMALSIVKAHDGWIDVSTELGKGSAFQIYIPAAVEPSKPGESIVPDKIGHPPLPRGSGTILYVDDEERIRTMAKVFLENLGYAVMLAKDGSDAVEQYVENQDKITAVISDMTMPRMTGRQMLFEILGTNPKAVVILASGYTNEGTREELIGLGAAEFIQKPYTIQILAEGLQQALLRHSKAFPTRG